MASHQENDAVPADGASASTAGGDGIEEVRVSFPETDRSEPEAMDADSAAIQKVDGEVNLASSSCNKKKSKARINGSKSQHRKSKKTLDDEYDSVLSAFDDYAAEKVKGEDEDESESVGYGYEVGDMVWGKVKSHPWWPGHIYSEEFASASVRRSKREGHVLVAFFGDSSYGWFDPAELIPFEENFAEKSSQTYSRGFVHAVEEAVDELSRRRSVGLACRCRNKFNFWPADTDGYLVVDAGDYEPGSYTLSQIREARDSFQPREMLSFIQQLALAPMNDHHADIEFMKNKATVLACRKAVYEEFDETYAEAFGSAPVRPPRPTAPASVDPTKAPLSGRLVIAEALGKGKIPVKSTKTKEQLEKDKYLFKRREETSHLKSKKASGASNHSILIDDSGSVGRAAVTGNELQKMGQHQPIVSETNFDGSGRLVDGGAKKAKAKRKLKELSSEDGSLIEKKKKKKPKKEIRNDISTDLLQAPVLGSSSAEIEVSGKQEKIEASGKQVLVSPVDNDTPDYPMTVVDKSLASQTEARQEVKTGQIDIPAMVRDLRCLALDPFYGEHRACAAITGQVFSKYRSLVYKKSLIPMPPSENEANEANKLSATLTVDRTSEKSAVKPARPFGRPEDPTKGGRKRGPLDRNNEIKKKKKVSDEEVKNKKQVRLDSVDVGKKKKPKEQEESRLKKKAIDFEDPKKKKMGDLKVSTFEKKNVQTILPKALKLESSKSVEKIPNPTMLVMRFPANAGLPSGAELRAKFARFGPMDHSATRIFWKSYQCRLVYQYKAHAEAALKFCYGSSNLFGCSNVKCHIRELAAEAAESEPVRVPKEETSIGASQPGVRTGQSQQPQPQLKSCLKKPADENGNGNGRGGSRVKFALGGEESISRSEPVPEGGLGSSSVRDSFIKNSVAPQPNDAISPPVQFSQSPGNISSDQHHRVFNPPPIPQMPVAPQTPIDISQQMLNLLTKCSHVVDNVRGVLGYMPYHPL